MSSKNIVAIAILLALALSLIPVSATSQADGGSYPHYDLLIIAPDEFMDEVEPLQRFKDASGRPTIVLSLSEVYANVNCSGGVDEPEKIKMCIAHYEQTEAIKYVMLVGDSDKFPVRYCCRDVPDPTGYQACDLYYADLYKSDGGFDDWDGNGNGLYAQLLPTSSANNVDSVNWHPDVAVARVPASSSTEVSTYVEKIISYELAASNSLWFQKALLVTGNWPPDEATKDHIATNYLTGFTIIKWYYSIFKDLYPIDPNDVEGSMDKRAQPMTDYINQGVGFLNHYGHGSIDDFAWVYDKRHLLDLTNTDKLPVIFSAGCATAEFAPAPPWQDYVDIYDVFHPAHAPAPGEIVPAPKPIQPGAGAAHDCDREARPEDWLVYRDSGAIAYLGSAGTANPGYPDILDKDFFKAYDLGYRTFGDMRNYMVEAFLDGHFDEQGNVLAADEWNRKATWNALIRFTPFGDPSLVVGGAFTETRSGSVWDDDTNGPWKSYERYHIVGDVTVPADRTLTAQPASSVLFEAGKKITAPGSDPSQGFRMNGTSDEPAWFVTLAPDPQSEHVVQGVKVAGQLRLLNGGQIKVH